MYIVPITVSLILIALWGGPAAACINDRDVNVAENEFKSQYQAPTLPLHKKETEAAGTQGTRRFNPYSIPIMGIGMLMLVGGIIITKRRA